MGYRDTRIPRYRMHRSSGQAVVTLSGVTTYLGAYTSPSSWEKYHKLVGEWIGRGRSPARSKEGVTVDELCRAYLAHAEGYYRKLGKPTSTMIAIKVVAKDVRAAWGSTPAGEYGPARFKATRKGWIERGLVRRTVNQYADKLRGIWKWGVAEELIPPAAYQGLLAVASLPMGRSEAPDEPEVAPVPLEVVEATLACLGREMAAMVRFQLLTACRPTEARHLALEFLDRSGAVWIYTVPAKANKSHHRKRPRRIAVGPRAQEAIAGLLALAEAGPAPHYLFVPRGRGRKPGCSRYASESYLCGVARAAKRAGVPRWHPNQLRHAAATLIRSRFDRETARTILGHSKDATTEIYALEDLAKAIRAMGEMG